MERRNNCNPLMYKAALLYSELEKAQTLMGNIVSTLDVCNEESDLRNEIGIPYINKMPKFKIFEKEAAKLKDKLRKVCSGEVSIEEAKKEAKRIRDDLNEALQVMDREKLLPYCRK